MIKRIRNIKKIARQKKENSYHSLLEKLIILLISKGILTKEDYDNLRK